MATRKVRITLEFDEDQQGAIADYFVSRFGHHYKRPASGLANYADCRRFIYESVDNLMQAAYDIGLAEDGVGAEEGEGA